jgi:hypothetical protein
MSDFLCLDTEVESLNNKGKSPNSIYYMGPSERNQYVTCEVIVCRASNHDMFTDQLNLLFSVEFGFTIT